MCVLRTGMEWKEQVRATDPTRLMSGLSSAYSS
jgi:hypothetical protein